MSNLAVVGHVEWVHFLSVDHLPARGQIAPAERARSAAGGGAVVAAAVLAELGANVDFFGAVGDDALGDAAVRQLEELGVEVHVVRREQPTREVLTFIDADGERSIVTIGERLAVRGSDPLDWKRLTAADGVYFTAGDLDALHYARTARVLTSTPRIAEQLPRIDVDVDALIYSADDTSERDWASTLSSHARLRVITEGARGGHWSGTSSGSWQAVPPQDPVVDAYGAGDSFAAGFTFGLATSGTPGAAARIGAAAGARALTRVGAP